MNSTLYSAKSKSPSSRSYYSAKSKSPSSRSYYSAKSQSPRARSFPVNYSTIGTLASYLNAPTYRRLSQTTQKTKRILNRMLKPLPGLLQHKKKYLRSFPPTPRRTRRKIINNSYKNMLSSNLGKYNHFNSLRRSNYKS